MSDNPYEPPSLRDEAAGEPAFYFYRSTALLTKWLIGLLILSATMTAILGVLDVAAYVFIPGYGSGEFELEGVALPMMLAMMATGVGGIIVYLVCGVLFLIRIYRSTGNTHALGAQGIKVTPGWAVGYWFIPIVNLFRPYQATCEIFLAGASTDRINWSSRQVPEFLGPGGFAGSWGTSFPNSRCVPTCAGLIWVPRLFRSASAHRCFLFSLRSWS